MKKKKMRARQALSGLIACLPCVLAPGNTLAAGDDSKWQITVEGQPELSGKVVMHMPMGKLQKFSLIGGQSMVTVDVHSDSPDEPYLAQIIFLETDTICMRGLSSKPTNEVKLARDGEKYRLSGKIKCSHKDGGDSSLRPISGWFMK